jgi:hypothetical protein
MPTQISFYDQDGPVPTQKWLVASGAAATINPGTPTKFNSAGAVIPMVDANGTTSERFTGIAKTTSTDTAAAAGEVYTFIPLPGIQYAAKAKSATAANTQAKIDALLAARLVFDLTGTVGPGLTGTWTIDTVAGDGANNCVVIIGGEYQTNTLYFMYSSRGIYLNA